MTCSKNLLARKKQIISQSPIRHPYAEDSRKIENSTQQHSTTITKQTKRIHSKTRLSSSSTRRKRNQALSKPEEDIELTNKTLKNKLESAYNSNLINAEIGLKEIAITAKQTPNNTKSQKKRTHKTEPRQGSRKQIGQNKLHKNLKAKTQTR